MASFEALRAKADARAGSPDALDGQPVLSLGIAAIDDALPDGGLPRGSVVEVTASLGLGRATSFALAACAAAQRLAKLRSGNDRTVGAWCAFVDPWVTLHAPGAASAGVDLDRLLVLRPSVDALSRVAIRAAASRAFSVVVVDTSELLGHGGRARPKDNLVNVVRRIAVAIEATDTSVMLLTDASTPRAAPLPTAMRLELDVIARRGELLRGEADGPRSLRAPRPLQTLRIAKERRGRVSGPIAIAS